MTRTQYRRGAAELCGTASALFGVLTLASFASGIPTAGGLFGGMAATFAFGAVAVLRGWRL